MAPLPEGPPVHQVVVLKGQTVEVEAEAVSWEIGCMPEGGAFLYLSDETEAWSNQEAQPAMTH